MTTPTPVRIETVRALLRRGTWGVLATAVIGTVLFGYVFVAALSDLAGADPTLDPTSRRELDSLVSRVELRHLPASVALVGGLLLPVLGILSGVVVVAEDYRSGFLKVLYARGVGRSQLLRARTGVLGAYAVGGTLLIVVTAAVASVVTTADGSGVPDPGAVASVTAMGAAAWLMWGMIGALLVMVTRSSHLAITVAVGILVLGSVVTNAAAGDGDFAQVLSLLPLPLTVDGLAAAAEGESLDAAGLFTGMLAWAAVAVWSSSVLGARQQVR